MIRVGHSEADCTCPARDVREPYDTIAAAKPLATLQSALDMKSKPTTSLMPAGAHRQVAGRCAPDAPPLLSPAAWTAPSAAGPAAHEHWSSACVSSDGSPPDHGRLSGHRSTTRVAARRQLYGQGWATGQAQSFVCHVRSSYLREREPGGLQRSQWRHRHARASEVQRWRPADAGSLLLRERL